MRWLLLKDLQILRRSPLLCGLLVVYPVALALMIGVAFSSPPAKPTVAFVDEIPPGKAVVHLGAQTLNIGDYTDQLRGSVRALTVRSRAAAIADVRGGRALAAVVIPADLPAQIQSLITQGGATGIEIYLNDANPLERSYVHAEITTRLADVQTAVSKRVLQVAVRDLEQVLHGGRVQLAGNSVSLLGLTSTRQIVSGVMAALPSRSPLHTALAQVQSFAALAIAGLGFAKPVLGSIGSPLTVSETEVAGATTPTAVYAAAIAVVISLMFVAMLLAAGTLALERSEHVWARLTRGLISPGRVLACKVILAAGCAAITTLIMAAAVSAFVTLDWARLGLWVAAVACGGLAFAALGVALGAIAREVSAASLMAFSVALPIAFVALVPGNAVSSGVGHLLSVIAFLFPFKAALEAVTSAFAGGGGGPAFGLLVVHLLALAAAFGLVARVAVRRFDAR